MPYPRSDVPVLARVPAAAVLTGAAGLVHMAAAVTHVAESLPFGLAFALTGWMQMISAVWLSAGRSGSALTIMSVTNVMALFGWVLSRTVGLPVLHPGVEVVGVADALTVVLEVLALGAAVTQVRGRGPREPARRSLPLGLATAGVFALGASGAAVAALGAAGGHGHGEPVAAGEGEHHGPDEGGNSDLRASAPEPSDDVSRQPGTLPASLHRHRPGVYHLHENIDLHQHARGIVHVHTKVGADPSSGAHAGDDDTGDGHENTEGHTH